MSPPGAARISVKNFPVLAARAKDCAIRMAAAKTMRIDASRSERRPVAPSKG
jgi:hypothetical protein